MPWRPLQSTGWGESARRDLRPSWGQTSAWDIVLASFPCADADSSKLRFFLVIASLLTVFGVIHGRWLPFCLF
jgi:hypothetical protein